MEQFITVDEVAERLKVSRMTIYRYIKSGKIPAYKLDHGLRIKQADIEQFLNKQKVKI